MSKRKIIYLFLLVAIVCYANFVTKSFTFEPFYSLYSDSAALYPLQSLVDSSLFRSDLLSIALKDSFPHLNRENAFLGLYYILLHFFSLPTAVKLLSIILCVFAALLIYKIAVHLQSNAFLLSGLFLVYFLSMDSFFGGQQRCFGIFIFCIFLFLFCKEKFFTLPLVIPLAMFFYPYISILLTIVCILIPFFYKKNFSRLQLSLYILLLILAITVSAFLGYNSIFLKYGLNNLTEIQKYKYTYGSGGRIGIYNPKHILLFFIFNLNEHSKLYVYFTKFFLALCLFISIVRKKKAFNLPKPVWIIMLGSILGFLLTYPIHPVSASKQFVFSMPLFLVFFISVNLSPVINNKIKTDIFLISIMSIFLILHPKFNDMHGCRKYKQLYDYVGALPKDVVMAGHPESLFIKTIPFFSKRTIFFADEFSDLSLVAYDYREIQNKRDILIKAIYSDSLDEMKNLALKYNIDYFIIESSFYQGSFIDSLKNSLSLFDQQAYGYIQRKNNKNNFITFQFAKKDYDFKFSVENNDIFIFRAEKIAELK